MSDWQYENNGHPSLETFNNVFWYQERETRKGWMRTGSILDDSGKHEIAKIVEFNGPERPHGEIKGMFQCVDVTPPNGDTFTQYQLLGSDSKARA